jgi:hypothetical protein
MAPLPPLQQLGFGTSRWRLQGTLHQACAQAEEGIIFLPHKSPLLAHSGQELRQNPALRQAPDLMPANPLCCQPG